MAGKVAAASPASFEYEIFESDNRLQTVVATSKQTTMWIDPATLKLRHRIGRGPFGETWLATLHQSTDDYDEYHEVAVKMLPPVKGDHMRVLLDKLDDLFSKCQGVEGVCCLQGISAMNGKICLVMKFYEGSVGDKMARLKGGKLSLSNAFRYIINLAQGILELHSKKILILNLKPFNFLLNEYNQAVVGDVGIPYILLGIPLPSSDLARRIGTPNYMAPEQWQPEVRGPISFETDSWGFACSIVEMLTGVQPWCGKSVDEIYDAVVRKQEKPCIPSGLPPPIVNVLLGCFEYDFRSRPLMTDILRVFKSLQNAVHSGGWTDLESIIPAEKSSSGYTEWFLSKDDLQVGDMVRSRKPANSCKPDNMDVPEGTVVGLEHSTERDGFVLVRVHGIHDPLRVHVSSLERVTFGLAAGDWVRMKEEDKRHSPVGILHSIHRDGNVAVGFIGLETLRKGKSSELQMAESYSIGKFVRLKDNVLSPRFEWPRKAGGAWATGRICWVLPNGCLVVKFPGRLTFGEDCSSFLADPAEVEAVTFSTCPGMVKKYQHLEDHHWVVRPLLIALGLFTAMKMGIFVGRKVRGGSKMKKQPTNVIHTQHMDGQATGNPGWLPPSVANILFKEGVSTAR
ncbi:E3 ubiquitin-protein ligase KEG-like [Pistacia vera]|uniref:E3 ubiquitin-protein ligase KEG-like n=1 Tax=Pistacia vera TaxID=55513 RepID=UPI0012637B36|nr:E3 ubiquitin-protein ligase KEG-like [Pistacia vera]XP_031279543.1 E3 ubiquitin-protein ligase KEG-like [Pistacia vera]